MNKCPKFRPNDDKERANPYGWDFGHGRKRQRPTFKTKKEKDDFEKEFKRRWFSDQHAVVTFNPEEWRDYLRFKRKLKEAGATVEQAVDFFLKHDASKRGKIPNFSELLERRLEGLRLKKGRAIGHAELYGGRFLSAMGDKPANMYTRQEVQDYINEKVKQGRSRATCKGVLKHIAAIFNIAVDDGLLSKPPTDKITLPSGRGEKRMDIINPDDLRRLLDHAWGADRTMAGLLAIMFFTGIRSSMVAPSPEKLKTKEFIRLDMIDREKKTIIIPAGIMKSEAPLIIEEAPDCLWGWLTDLKKSDFGIPQNPFNIRKNKLIEPLGIEWPTNLHRRSFASYLAVLRGPEHAYKIMGGETQSVFSKHYKVATLKAPAEKYVNIFR